MPLRLSISLTVKLRCRVSSTTSVLSFEAPALRRWLLRCERLFTTRTRNCLSTPWSQTRLLTIFSILALLLAAIGIYGVLACSVAERTHEIGIRMAVGASRSDIVWMVIRRTLVLTATGAVAGIAGALTLTRVLIKLLFEVTPTDPGTFFAVTGILAAVAVVASLMPARRAARVYPLEALRHE
jgi:putative ABC transport system permease protein